MIAVQVFSISCKFTSRKDSLRSVQCLKFGLDYFYVEVKMEMLNFFFSKADEEFIYSTNYS